MRWLVIIFVIVTAAGFLAFAAVVRPWQSSEPVPIIASSDSRDPMPEGKAIEVQYIANEGVLITAGDKRVLIDGLHRKYADAYAYLPDVEREKIETAKPPFDAIDLLLVSHRHGDHYHPESVGRYLQSNSKTVLATSGQVAGELAERFAGYAQAKDRVLPVNYAFRERETKSLAGIDVEFLSVGHGSGRHAEIQNLGHIFSVGGKKFLHLGDAVPSVEIFDHYEIDKQGIDIAFLPAWFLTSESGRTIIREHIKPKHIIAVHVGPSEGETLKKQIAKDFPAADVFSTMLEKRHF